jgi:uncharacterized protein YndB with AHSA1/START domain
MLDQIITTTTVKINAPVARVWNALTDPDVIKEYMFDTTVISDWKEGGSITWKGEWKGKPYEDNGVILSIVQEKLLQYSHFSSAEDMEDKEENYHIVTIELFDEPDGVLVVLSQDNNASQKAKDESEKNWNMMLQSMKEILEHETSL